MISIRNVNFHVNNTIILKDINLELSNGEFASIIGPNGAGKSTLLKIILGQIPVNSGEITIDGIPHRIWLRKHIIGYMPQKEEVDKEFPATALDIVLMGLAGKKGLFRNFNTGDTQAALEIMDWVGVLPHKHKFIKYLSGGEFQRVLLARALVSNPDYLFLDEPDASVDRDGVFQFYNLLTELHKAQKTILMVSHDLHNTNKYCSQIICLNKTLHCHTQPELVNSEIIRKTFGDVIQIIERKPRHD